MVRGWTKNRMTQSVYKTTPNWTSYFHFYYLQNFIDTDFFSLYDYLYSVSREENIQFRILNREVHYHSPA
jgi:hypothetical protein